ncbi:hypothetical protein [Paenibacillus sp. YPG26]|uniref:hypothetical protein n=1 Tax=Paenibacillus sp. YPG26 TaxID=2878915 RepID=UPI00204062A2|nr:hypothetical protein [Paenibacillus sp. YPG26]USB35175.1 hypothetical protein LDO05_11700 [Paenibacillus sp. YPG26]
MASDRIRNEWEDVELNGTGRQIVMATICRPEFFFQQRWTIYYKITIHDHPN